MKRSFIITVNNFMKKTVLVLLFVIAAVILYDFGVFNYVFEAMAHDAVFLDDEKNFLSDGNLMYMIINSEKKADFTPVIIEKNNKKDEVENNENKSEIVLKDENEPDNVDFSNEKSSISVVNNNIIVSNAAKKNFNIENLLKLPLNYTKGDGYKVLIIHTHTTESYMPDDRNEDQSKNIVRVGEEFAKVLNERGVKTLHEKTVHDAPYSLSYVNELKSIESILLKHPSIEVIIDVHRDALYNSKNEKIKPVATVNNQKAAQVMLVCGTDAMGLPHENWQSCFSFALKIQNDMNKNYPNLARPVNLREERFNTHKTKNSVIFEIGANGNTLDEAILGGRCAAQSIANVLNGM